MATTISDELKKLDDERVKVADTLNAYPMPKMDNVLKSARTRLDKIQQSMRKMNMSQMKKPLKMRTRTLKWVRRSFIL